MRYYFGGSPKAFTPPPVPPPIPIPTTEDTSTSAAIAAKKRGGFQKTIIAGDSAPLGGKKSLLGD
jgi:hypothetical protein